MMALCYSKKNFERICSDNGWNDDFRPDDFAFISICCLPEVVENVLDGDDAHYFKSCHDNVLNVEFDDITEDIRECDVDGKKFTARGLDDGTAARIVEFIVKNHGKTFMVHCRAGKSRSQAVIRFIIDLFPEYDVTNPDNPCLYPNMHTYRKLVRSFGRMN